MLMTHQPVHVAAFYDALAGFADQHGNFLTELFVPADDLNFMEISEPNSDYLASVGECLC